MIDEVYNNLTKRLDELSDRKKYINQERYKWCSHYLFEPYRDLPTGEIAIRVPGGTVGTLFVNDKQVITKISISTNYVVKYDNDVNEIINKEFQGKVLELPGYIEGKEHKTCYGNYVDNDDNICKEGSSGLCNYCMECRNDCINT